jgi:beta-glucosidase
VVSDCGALEDIHQHHKVADSAPAAAAMAVREGCDLCCGEIYRNLLDAVQQGLITEAEITLAVTRLFTARFKLGMFDPEDEVRWSAIPPEVVGCEAHRDLALQSARKSMVLLKNNGVLPLSREKGNIGVFGPTALDSIVLLGNYNGYAPALTTILEGIVAKAPPGVNVVYGKACELAGKAPISGGLGWWASECSVVVAVVGNNAEIEGEEGDAYNAEAGGDRVRLGLPGRQQEFLETLKRMGKPLVVVLTTGSAVDLCWAEENADAIVCAWYPGEAGGRAVADVLFGDYNPGGKLPVTFVQSVEQLPPFTDYAMKGRTYRFLETPPLYRFGFGLSFTTFATRDLKLGKATVRSDEPQEVSVTVANTGARAGDEVVQVYLQDVQASVPAPRWQLVAFERVNLKAGEERTLRFRIGPDQMVAYSDEGVPFVEPGEFRVYVGGGQPDDPRAGCQSATFRVVA